MSEEIEIKVLEINKKDIIQKLEKLGAKKVFEKRMKILMFDFPGRPLMKKKSFLRLRTEHNGDVLCFKQLLKKEKAKVAMETDIKIDDVENMKKILEKIGMIIVNDQEKDRIMYVYKDIEFCIDTWPNIPTFLEIEAKSYEKIKEGLKLLNIPENKVTNLDGYEIFKHYGIDIKDVKDLKF